MEVNVWAGELGVLKYVYHEDDGCEASQSAWRSRLNGTILSLTLRIHDASQWHGLPMIHTEFGGGDAQPCVALAAGFLSHPVETMHHGR
jgi:hypothetical protein